MKADKQVAFLGLSLDGVNSEDKESGLGKSASTLEETKVQYPNYVWFGEFDALEKMLSMKGQPHTVLLANDGKILTVIEVPEETEKIEAVVCKAVEGELAKLKGAGAKEPEKKAAEPEKK